MATGDVSDNEDFAVVSLGQGRKNAYDKDVVHLLATLNSGDACVEFAVVDQRESLARGYGELAREGVGDRQPLQGHVLSAFAQLLCRSVRELNLAVIIHDHNRFIERVNHALHAIVGDLGVDEAHAS